MRRWADVRIRFADEGTEKVPKPRIHSLDRDAKLAGRSYRDSIIRRRRLVDERRLRLYEFLLEMERITIDEVPDPYKTAIQEADELSRKKS